MKLELFDNNLGFKPSGKVLDWWKVLPQVQIDHNVPSLFGNIKSMTLSYFMVGLLILMEGILIYSLNEEGAMPLVLIILTVLDFAIIIIPLLIIVNKNLINSVLKAKLFITQYKLNTDHNVPDDFNGDESKYKDFLKREYKKLKSDKNKLQCINIATAIVILVFSYVKFQSIYGIFGEDIIIMSTGRLAVGVILLSIFVHLLFTKDVVSIIVFKRMLNNQLNDFSQLSLNKVENKDKNNTKEISFFGKYTYEKAGNQMIGKVVDSIDSTMDSQKLIKFENQRGQNFISLQKTENNSNVNLVWTGILTDPEISVLATAQSDTRLSVLCVSKEIQLSFS